MKATELQTKIIDTCISIIKTWKNSNDINSPTHYVDISEYIENDLFEESEELKESLDNILAYLLDIIKMYNKSYSNEEIA